MRVINQFVLAPGLARRGVGYPHRYDESWHSAWRELTGHLGIVTIVHSCDRASQWWTQGTLLLAVDGEELV